MHGSDLRKDPPQPSARGTRMMLRLSDSPAPGRVKEIFHLYPNALAPSGRQMAKGAFYWTLAAGLLVYAWIHLGLSLHQFGSGLGRLEWIFRLMLPPDTGGRLAEFLYAMLETLALALLATTVAAVVAFPLGFLAAKRVAPSRLLRFALRRGFDILRGIDNLIWALVFVSALGLGPFAGALALACADAGVLAKLFSEAVENADTRAEEGIRSVGGNRAEVIRFAILPEVLPVFLSASLYTLESTTRSASILGIVGGGGIGLQLTDRIRGNEWQEAAAILLIILAAVKAVDLFSSMLRKRLVGSKAT